MADAKQLRRLEKSIRLWNKWREDHPDASIDLIGAPLSEAKLSGADLSKAKLSRANFWNADVSVADLSETDLSGAGLIGTYLRRADLSGANLKKANLTGADLRGANLRRGHLSGANLYKSDLSEANLIGADLRGANLKMVNLNAANLYKANLIGADLSEADLNGADLRGAKLRGAKLGRSDLTEANLNNADLNGADFLKARMSYTIFAHLVLSEAVGLEDVVHNGPSTIGTNILVKSKGKIPEVFLRGCGLSDWEIEAAKLYNPDLSNEEISDVQYRLYELRATQALQISPLFISYSHRDSAFVDKVGDCLKDKGVRYWRDIHKAIAGPLEEQIDRAIRHNPTVLLVLSEHSIKSDWVEHEVRAAREVTKELERHVLCPVALDDSWKSSPWPQRVMEQIREYNILDFSDWKDRSKFDGMFRKLIDGLELFYKG